MSARYQSSWWTSRNEKPSLTAEILRRLPALASELPKSKNIVSAVKYVNKLIAGSGWQIVGRTVHVPTRFGTIKQRLYEKRRVA